MIGASEAATVHEYDHHIGDYTKDTVGLSMVEDGGYRRLLDQYYARELPLPPDKPEVYRMARAGTTAERKVVDYVLDRYFMLRADGYHNARADKEIEKLHGRSAKAKAAALERWERERERAAAKFGRRVTDGGAKSDANASPEHMQKPCLDDANASVEHGKNDANASPEQCSNDANAMPPAGARPHARTGAAFRLPPSGLPSSELQNRDVVVDQPCTADQPPGEHVNGNVALGKTGTSTAKLENAGQQWRHPAYVEATAKTLGIPRRANEDDDAFKDRVYSAVQERRASR